MAGETVVTVIGNLTADPELRTLATGATVVNFTVAATPRTFNRQSNQWEDGQALFLRCSCWRDLANHCAQSLKKGVRVIAQGRLTQRSYQAQDGSNRTVMELQVDDIGPSLRYAVAAVARQSQSNGFHGNQAGQQTGYSGGASTYGAQPAVPSAPQQPEGDPWAAGDAGAADFGGGFDDDPAF